AAMPAHATLHGFDIPGGGTQNGHGTYVNGINISGDVVGYVVNDSGQASGFMRNATGTFTVFTGPENADTHAVDIHGGTMTGYFPGGDSHNHGYIRHLEGDFTIFDPRHSQGTQAISINKHEGIAGQYSDSKESGLQRGFLRKPNGSFEAFDGSADAQ